MRYDLSDSGVLHRVMLDEGETDVVILNSVTKIGNYAFENCFKMTSIEIPNSVTSIGYCAFWNCFSLSNVIIPNSVTEIEDWAFKGCKSLTSVIIPDSVTKINTGSGYENPFAGCTKATIYANAEITKMIFPFKNLFEAVNYLSKPESYSGKSAEKHVKYCKEQTKKLLGLIIGSDNISAMKGYAETVGIDSQNYDSIYEAACNCGAEKIMSFLTEYKI